MHIVDFDRIIYQEEREWEPSNESTFLAHECTAYWLVILLSVEHVDCTRRLDQQLHLGTTVDVQQQLRR